MAKSKRNRNFEQIIANKVIELAVKNLAKNDLKPGEVRGEF